MSTRRIARLHKVPSAEQDRRARLYAASDGNRAHASRVLREVKRAELAHRPTVLQPGRARPRTTVTGAAIVLGLALGVVAWGLIVTLSFLVYELALR
jgi:Flp pilus assembly protein TadB